MSAWGVLDPTQPPSRFVVAHGTPYLFVPDDVTGPPVRHRLTEVEPGVFLADNGETLDMRGRVATWASIRLVRVSGGPAAWQWAVLGTAAALAGLWLVLALARGLTNRRRGVRRSGPSRVLPAAVATAAALLVLGTGALLVSWPGLVDSGFLGWLDFPLPVRLALHLPTALVVAAAGTAVVAAAGWRRRWWPREVLVQHAVLALGAVVVAAQVLAWGLVGWGFT
jgi:hypothetical protein